MKNQLKGLIVGIHRANDFVAVFVSNIVGTMWCAYAFAALACVSLPEAIHGGTATLVAWIAQTFLQLVLLSIIMVGQDVQSRKANKRAEQDHKTIMAEFVEMKALHADLHILIDNNKTVAKKTKTPKE